MNRLLDQSDAVFVVPSRPAAERRRYRRTCTWKAICYAFQAAGLICLLVDISFGLPLSGPAALLFVFTLICYFACKTLLAIRENRLESTLTSSKPQRLTSWWATLDLLLPWPMNPLEVTVYPPSQLDLPDSADEHSSARQQSPQAAVPVKSAVEAASAIVHIGISLLGKLTILLYGANGQKVEISFKTKQSGQSRYAALIAYLAVIGKCSWITRIDILRAIYRTVANASSSFDTDRLRIQELIDAVARSSGLIPVKLFEKGKNELNEPAWRLSSLCEVDVAAFDVLLYWFPRIIAVQTNQMDIELGELRRVSKHVIQAYADGYLTQHLHEHEIWSWAKEQYFEYRNIYLTILEYAAEGEIKAGRLRPDIQMECLLRAAHLYERCALTAITAIPDTQRGERYLGRCLEIYRDRLHDSQAAARAKEAYDRQLKRNNPKKPPN